MKNLIKEFIIEEHSNACSEWKAKIEDKYPDLFKSEIEVGKWYKHKSTGNAMLFLKDTSLSAQGFLKPNIGYGVDYKGNWTDNVTLIASTPDDLTPATDKEVKDALVAEARKRGVKEGCVHSTTQSAKDRIILNAKQRFCYVEWQNKLLLNNWSIFHDGKWATIIEEEETVWSILAKQNLVNPADVKASIEKIQAELQSLKELIK